jgi:tRNA-modifying protein YgfZ
MVAMASATAINFPPHIRADRAVIRVAGEGALAFLHNVLTTDLTEPKPAYAALLTPQGKILHDLFVVPDGDTIWLDVARPQAPDLLKRLIMYRLRAKLDITIDDTKMVVVSSSPTDHSYADPRTSLIGYRAIQTHSVIGGAESAHDGYLGARLALGLADSIADIGSGELFVHEANFDQLHGVSFSKGCYVGQEVVSRTHHRHTTRNRILPVTLEGPVAHGSDITSGDQRIGSMLSSHNGQGLALIRIDRLAEAKAPLLSNAVRIRVSKPAWATFDLTIPELAQ